MVYKSVLFDPIPELAVQGRGRMKVLAIAFEANRQFLSFLRKKSPSPSSTNPPQSFNSKHLFFAASTDGKEADPESVVKKGCSFSFFQT